MPEKKWRMNMEIVGVIIFFFAAALFIWPIFLQKPLNRKDISKLPTGHLQGEIDEANKWLLEHARRHRSGGESIEVTHNIQYKSMLTEEIKKREFLDRLCKEIPELKVLARTAYFELLGGNVFRTAWKTLKEGKAEESVILSVIRQVSNTKEFGEPDRATIDKIGCDDENICVDAAGNTAELLRVPVEYLCDGYLKAEIEMELEGKIVDISIIHDFQGIGPDGENNKQSVLVICQIQGTEKMDGMRFHYDSVQRAVDVFYKMAKYQPGAQEFILGLAKKVAAS